MINSEKMRELEANSEKLGVSKLQLMENAGHGLYQIIKEKYNLENKKILIIANHGNNGGDGFVLARYLKQNNYNVKVYFIGEQTRLKKESGYNYFFLKDSYADVFTKEFIEADIIVDAIFGTGIQGKIRQPYSTIIDKINSSNKTIISVDIPSGMNPDTGEYEKAVNPNLIITFHDIKKGIINLKEKTVVVDIGIKK